MASRLGIIGGSGLDQVGLLERPESIEAETPHGAPSAPLQVGTGGAGEVVFLPRHGAGHRLPPHRVNHHANLWALRELDVDRLVGTASAGSLDLAIRPGSLVIPEDYLAPWAIPTYQEVVGVHVTPGLDLKLRHQLAEAAQSAGIAVHQGGVYVQTTGPRLETRAEVRMLRQFGDLVGMTLASEATLAAELGIRYAGLCSVDNYAHGLVDEPLTYPQIVAAQKVNARQVESLLQAFLGASA